MTGGPPDLPSGRRFLLTGVVSSYQYEPHLDVPGLLDDQARRVGLFSERFGYRSRNLGANLDEAGLKRALRGFAREPDRHPDDYVVVYLAGHGELVDLEDNVREYRFLASDAKRNDLVGTGVRLDDIADWLLAATSIRRLLIILDTCYAGDAVIDF